MRAAVGHCEIQADLAAHGGAVQRIAGLLHDLVGDLVGTRRQWTVEVLGEPLQQFRTALGEPVAGRRHRLPVKALQRIRHRVGKHKAVIVQRTGLHDCLAEFRRPGLLRVFAPLFDRVLVHVRNYS